MLVVLLHIRKEEGTAADGKTASLQSITLQAMGMLVTRRVTGGE